MEDFSGFSRDEYYNYVKIQLMQTEDLQSLFLKGQILTEYTLHQFLLINPTMRKTHYSNSYFSFKNKIETARDFSSLGKRDPKTIEALFLIYEIKNGIIETLQIQQQKIILLINCISGKPLNGIGLYRTFERYQLVQAFSELASNIFWEGIHPETKTKEHMNGITPTK